MKSELYFLRQQNKPVQRRDLWSLMVKITKSPLPNKQKARTVLKGKELRPCFCTIFPKIEKPGRCILRLRPVSKDARKRHTFFPEHTLKKASFFFFSLNKHTGCLDVVYLFAHTHTYDCWYDSRSHLQLYKCVIFKIYSA